MNYGNEIPNSIYKYRVVSVEHLKELQEDFEALDSAGKIKNHPVFRSYIANKKHHLPEFFLEAKSVIVMAVFTPLMIAHFQHKGTEYEIPFAHYYDEGITEEQLKNTIQNQIIGNDGFRIENARMHVLLKRLAVRSGLGKYGRNNLCYVQGMGSFLTLFAFFTDFPFDVDNWQPVEMMESCRKCKVCQMQCPTGSISDDNFVINIERCIPLYNEIPGEFPLWLKPESHNTLMGCLRCQLPCPANSEVVKKAQSLDSVTEEETRKMLNEVPDEGLYQSLSDKLRMFNLENASYFFPIVSRNLRALFRD